MFAKIPNSIFGITPKAVFLACSSFYRPRTRPHIAKKNWRILAASAYVRAKPFYQKTEIQFLTSPLKLFGSMFLFLSPANTPSLLENKKSRILIASAYLRATLFCKNPKFNF